MDNSNEPDNWIPTSFPSTPEATEGDSMSSFHSAATPGSAAVDLQSDDQSFDAVSRQKLNLTIHTSPRSPRIPGMSMFEEDTRSSWSVEPKLTQLRESVLEDDSRNSTDSQKCRKEVSNIIIESIPDTEKELDKSSLVKESDNSSSKDSPVKDLSAWNVKSDLSDTGDKDETDRDTCILDTIPLDTSVENKRPDADIHENKLDADSNIDQSNLNSGMNVSDEILLTDNIDSNVNNLATESFSVDRSDASSNIEDFSTRKRDSSAETLESVSNVEKVDSYIEYSNSCDVESNKKSFDRSDSNFDKLNADSNMDKLNTDSIIDKLDVHKNMDKEDIDLNIKSIEPDTNLEKLELDLSNEKLELDLNSENLEPDSNNDNLEPCNERLDLDLNTEKSEADSNVERQESDLNVEELRSDSNIEKIEASSSVGKVISDLNIERLDEDSNIEKLDEYSNIEKLDEDSNIEKLDEDSNIEKLDEDSNIEKLDEGSNIEKLDEDSNIEKLDEDSNIEKLNEDLNIEKLDEDSNIEILNGDSNIERLSSNLNREKHDANLSNVSVCEKDSVWNVDSVPVESKEVPIDEESQNPPTSLEPTAEKSVWNFKKAEDMKDPLMDEDSQMSTSSRKSREKILESSKRAISPTVIPSLDEESRSSIISQKSHCSQKSHSSQKSSKRARCSDDEVNAFLPENLFEYMWPQENGEFFILQEQICDYLNIKSFKRKYPDLARRSVDMDEKQFLKDKGVVTEMQCDLGLTALRSDEVLELMSKDYPDHYKDYIRVLREKEKQSITEKHKEFVATNSDKTKMVDLVKKAMQSAAEYNAHLNQERREERRSCMDLQTYTIHYPVKKSNKPKPNTKPGKYPVALLPGQFQDYYKEYTPAELKYLPVNTVLYGPLKELQSTKALSEGSQSDSEDSSASEGSCSSSQGTADDSSSGSEKNENGKTPSDKNGTTAETTAYRPKVKPNAVCKVCKKGAEGKPDELVHCSECDNSAHPSCIELTTEVVDVLKTYPWQCMDCKVCSHCSDPNDEDKMLFCDFCDRGYHTFCVGLKNLPQGKWVCRRCGSCSICGATKPGPETSKAQWLYDSAKGVVELDANRRPKIMCQSCFKKKR